MHHDFILENIIGDQMVRLRVLRPKLKIIGAHEHEDNILTITSSYKLMPFMMSE